MPRPHQLPHKLTRWRQSGTPDMYGRRTFVVAVFDCRYMEVNKLYVGEDGSQQRSNAYIYTEGDMLQLGDVVMKGDHSASASPPPNAFIIRNRRLTTSQDGTRLEHRYIM